MTDIFQGIDTCDCCVFALARVLVSARFHKSAIASRWVVSDQNLLQILRFIHIERVLVFESVEVWKRR